MLQRRADRADAAVHHVRRRDDVAAGFGLDHSLPNQNFDRFVVGDIVVDQHAVMAMVV